MRFKKRRTMPNIKKQGFTKMDSDKETVKITPDKDYKEPQDSGLLNEPVTGVVDYGSLGDKKEDK